jgi:hypothetical protein
MTKRSMNELKKKLRLPGHFSYPTKPVTMAVPVIFTPCTCNMAELLGDAIRQYVELTGIVPFDWEHISPLPQAYQSQMRNGGR